MVAESQSDFNSDPVRVDDCGFGPTWLDLEIDPPRQILGYEWWDNDEFPSNAALRSYFVWRNEGSSGDLTKSRKAKRSAKADMLKKQLGRFNP